LIDGLMVVAVVVVVVVVWVFTTGRTTQSSV
jgi:hypothetical protein